jgi:hypothetical protein
MGGITSQRWPGQGVIGPAENRPPGALDGHAQLPFLHAEQME